MRAIMKLKFALKMRRQRLCLRIARHSNSDAMNWRCR